jgi:hypothetical protein
MIARTRLGLCAAAGAGFVLAAVLVTGAPAGAASGTPVCGDVTTTVWSALGSPYVICPTGITVDTGADVAIDGSAGPVQVITSAAPIVISTGAAITATNTSTTNHVTIGPPGGGSFDGIRVDGALQLTDTEIDAGQITSTGAVTLSRVRMPHVNCAAISARAGSVSVDTSSLSADGAACPATDAVDARGVVIDHAAVQVTNSTIDWMPREAMTVWQGTDPSSAPPVTVTGDTFDHDGLSGQPAVTLSAPTLQLTNDVFTNNGDGVTPAPPVALWGWSGPAADLAGLTGGGNTVDAVDLLHDTVTGDVSWPAVTNAPAVHALGWIGRDVTAAGPGTVTVPAGGNLAAGTLHLDGASLDASAGQARFTVPTTIPNCQEPAFVDWSCAYSTGHVGSDGGSQPVHVTIHSAATTAPSVELGQYTPVAAGSSVTITDSPTGYVVLDGSSGSAELAHDRVVGNVVTAGGVDTTVTDTDFGPGGVLVNNSAPRAVAVTDSTAGFIDVTGATQLVITGNYLPTREGMGGGYMHLGNSTFRPVDIAGNTGDGASYPYLELDGDTMLADGQWVPRSPSGSGVVPFGWVLGRGGLTVPTGTTLTVPDGTVVETVTDAGSITVDGGTLRTTGHTRFLGMGRSGDPLPCSFCGGYWSGIHLVRGQLLLAGAALSDIFTGDVHAALTIDDGTATVRCVAFGASFGSLALQNTGGTVSVEESDFGGVKLATTKPMDATYNWWGQRDGPTAQQVSGPADTSHPLGMSPSCVTSGRTVLEPPQTTVTSPTRPLQLAATAQFRYIATDHAYTVTSYDVAYRRAGIGQRLGRYAHPSGWQNLTTLTVNLRVRRGDTVCVIARAHDQGGRTGPWSTPRCVARPLDNPALSADSNWRTVDRKTDWGGSHLRTTRHGARVTVGSVSSARRVALLVTTCETCGTVQMRIGSTIIGKIDTHSDTIRHRQIRVVRLPAAMSGTLTVTVTSTNRRVLIDGAAVSHS